MEEKHLVCIQCPVGCRLTVEMDNKNVVSVKGNTCKRGEIYAKKELTAPTRTVTSTVKLEGGSLQVIPVKTQSDIPKYKVFSCMDEINKVVAKAPVEIGDVIIENVCDTGVNVIATAKSR